MPQDSGFTPGGAEAQAERIASLIFLVSRGGQLVFSGLMAASDRRRYASPVLQLLAMGGVVIESGWVARRILKSRRYDDRLGPWVDTVTAAAAVVVCQRGLGSSSAAPWAKNIAIGAAVGDAGIRKVSEAAAAVAVLCAAGVATGMRAHGRDSHVAGMALAVNDAVNWAGTDVAARSYVNAHRRYGRLRDAADAAAVERATATAAEAERARQQVALHQVTIDVLRRLSVSASTAEAFVLARGEAARLRFALINGGHLPQGLQQALAEVVARLSDRGMRVELVTAELTEIPSPETTAVLAAAARAALTVALESGGARRAVVRAVTTGDSVILTVRDHGCGFEPRSGSAYEARLRETRGLVSATGGDLTFDAEPENGVRLTLKHPLLARRSGVGGGADDTTQRVPHERIGPRPARDDEDAVGQGDIDRAVSVSTGVDAAAGSRVEGAQNEVRLTRIDQIDIGDSDDSLEPSAQQGLSGGDGGPYARLRHLVHELRVAFRPGSGVVRNTQFGQLSATDTRLADRTLLTALLAWRLTGFATGVASLVAGRERYRSRSAGVTQLALSVVESAWYACRVSRADRWADIRAADVDVLNAIAVLAIGHWNLEPADRVTWINWAPWTLAANAVCGAAMGVPPFRRAACLGGVVIAVYAAQTERRADAVANSAALFTFFGVSRLFGAQIRESAIRLDRARIEAVREGQAFARARERSTQLRLLHDHALQTLETIAGGRFSDLVSLQASATAEAARLDREVNQRDALRQSLEHRLRSVISHQTESGLLVDFDCRQMPVVREDLTDAMSGAVNEALTNVRKHSRVDRARVEVVITASVLVVTISDRGVGFDRSSASGGFGMGESIIQRMHEAGGEARIESALGAGTRVTLSGRA